MTYIQIVSDRSHILRNQVMEEGCFEVLILSNFHVAMTMYTMYPIYNLADSGDLKSAHYQYFILL